MTTDFIYLKEAYQNGGAPGNSLSVLEWHVDHPDNGSQFEKAVMRLGNIPAPEKIKVLLGYGFDTLLKMDASTLVSFVAVQRHPDRGIGLFKVHTEDAYRRMGHGVSTLRRFVDDAFASGKYGRIQAGLDNNESMRRCVASLKRKYDGPHQIEVTTETGLIKLLSAA